MKGHARSPRAREGTKMTPSLFLFFVLLVVLCYTVLTGQVQATGVQAAVPNSPSRATLLNTLQTAKDTMQESSGADDLRRIITNIDLDAPQAQLLGQSMEIPSDLFADAAYSDEPADEDEVDSSLVAKVISLGEEEAKTICCLQHLQQAWYGGVDMDADSSFVVDITKEIKSRLSADFSLTLPLDKHLNAIAGRDPTPGFAKKLYIKFLEEGHVNDVLSQSDGSHTLMVKEGATDTFPEVKSGDQILKAWYGPQGMEADSTFTVDVTEKIREYVGFEGKLSMSSIGNLNSLAKKDPAPGFEKFLFIKYMDHRVEKVDTVESMTINEDQRDQAIKGILKIEAAVYGTSPKVGESSKDVTEIVQSELKDNELRFERCLNCMFGDPAPGLSKFLYLRVVPVGDKWIPKPRKAITVERTAVCQAHYELRFMITGDWGSTSGSKNSVAKGMAKCQESFDGHFVISVGDHFYPKGVVSEDDPRFESEFENFFDKSLAPWYLVLGNHDWYADGFAQVRYSKKNERWVLPELFYERDYTFDGKEVPVNSNQPDKVRFIYIDTCAHMCGGLNLHKFSYRGRKYDHARTMDYLDNCGSCGSDMKRLGTWEEHHQWFKDKLEIAQDDPNVRHVVVTGHHSIVTAGGHASPLEWGQRLVTLAHRYTKWIVYFAGHNHGFEYSTLDRGPDRNQLHQFATGAGGNTYAMSKFSLMKGNAASLGFLTEYTLSQFGFMNMMLTATGLKLELIDQRSVPLFVKAINLVEAPDHEDGPGWMRDAEKAEAFPAVADDRMQAINSYFGAKGEDVCAPDPSSVLKWMAVGAWGAEDKEDRKAREDVAGAMAKCHKTFKQDFVVSTGDQFFQGVTSPHSKKLTVGFGKTFNELELPWFPVLGEEDWAGDPDQLVTFSKHHVSWEMSARQYVVDRPITDGPKGRKGVVRLIFADTCAQMCGATDHEGGSYPDDLAPICAACPSDLRLGSLKTARAWLRSKLAAAEVDQEVLAVAVIGHHPIVTGVDESASGHEWKSWMVRMAETYSKWFLYFAGHAHALELHTLERRTVIHNGGDDFQVKKNERFHVFHHIVSGGGGSGSAHRQPVSRLKFGDHEGPDFWKELNTAFGDRGEQPLLRWHFGFRSIYEDTQLGFVSVRLGWDFLRIEFHDASGTTLHGHTAPLQLVS